MPETIVSLVQTHHARPNRLGVVLAHRLRSRHEQPRHRRAAPARARRGPGRRPLLLAQARERARPARRHGGLRRRRLPRPSLPDGSSDIVVAAFCLYHSPSPQDVVGQIARVLAPGGVAVLVTKGLDSYREMDHLVASAGLDPRAAQHESLYTAAHSGNLADLAASSLDVIAVLDEEHVFTYDGHDHTVQYLATNPKYDLAPGLYGNPGALAATLHEFLPDQPLTTRSRITFVVAQPKGGGEPT
ncbi:class I SAM-dependent methyltransferase [Streptomyces thinghirensis]|nr:class I SAM-dependent methyltransferase [Streptomyces thinghirensis]